MKTEMYVIFDKKAKLYNKPFHQFNRDVAIRTVTDLANDTSTDFSRNPEDYSLFFLGTFDEQTAVIALCESPEHVVNFHELISHG